MRIGALHQQMRDTMRKRVGLAGPRARDDQQWTCAELDRFALRLVELVQIGRRFRWFRWFRWFRSARRLCWACWFRSARRFYRIGIDGRSLREHGAALKVASGGEWWRVSHTVYPYNLPAQAYETAKVWPLKRDGPVRVGGRAISLRVALGQSAWFWLEARNGCVDAS
jgi:hypothetical protein